LAAKSSSLWITSGGSPNVGHHISMGWDRVARRQGGVVRRSQLLAAGVTDNQIRGLVGRGLLNRTVYTGVYRAGGAPAGADFERWQAVLGSNAPLSYISAAQVWKLPVADDGRLHVTCRERRRFDRRANLRVHRTLLSPSAVTDYAGLPITTRTETLLDCLGWIRPTEACTLLDRAFQQKWLRPLDLRFRLDDQPGRWGNRQLSDLLAQSEPGTEAESERRLIRILRTHGISGWTPNLPVTIDGRRFRIDLAFKQLKIAVEVEGWAFHRDVARRDADLAKLNGLTAAGWRVLVFNWAQVNDPEYVLSKLLPVLAASGGY
jgi:very-short-patch-repair endonuclease